MPSRTRPAISPWPISRLGGPERGQRLLDQLSHQCRVGLGGGIIGFLLAWRPSRASYRVDSSYLDDILGVASNFAGVPLAFAFLATLGRVGLVTALMNKYLGFNLYSTGFNILSFTGLTLTYLYFQIPLMVLIVSPALEGLKREWREACDCLAVTPTTTGVILHCRCCGPASWAPCCFCLPTPLARWPQPMR
ncbi:hypothetical protein QNM99_17370 [Pseudomonas sp. PCH446]